MSLSIPKLEQEEVDYDVIIVGGGIAGMAVAVGLLQRGITKIRLYEKATKLQPIGAAIGLFPNGFNALEAGISSNVATRCKESSIDHEISQMYDAITGNLVREVNLKDKDNNNPVTQPTLMVWYLLQQYLAEELDILTTNTNTANNNKKEKEEEEEEEEEEGQSSSQNNNIIRLGYKVESYQVDDDGIVTVIAKSRDHLEEEKETTTTTTTRIEKSTCRVLIGADGINSTIRQLMFPPHINININKNYHGKLMFRAVLDMNILFDDDDDDGTTIISKLKQQFKKKSRMAWQGNIKGKLFSLRETAKDIVTFTSMAVFDCDEYDENQNETKTKTKTKEDEDSSNNNNNKDDSSSSSSTKRTKKIDPDSFLMSTPTLRKQRLQELFHDYPETVLHVLDRVPAESIYENVVYDIDILEQWSVGPVVLIGDAAHAMTPGLGQGANQGLEDACELAYAIASVFNKTNTNSALNEGEEEDDEKNKQQQQQQEQQQATNYYVHIIPKMLEEFYILRLDRVRNIHASSRAMTHQVNQSDKSKNLFGRTQIINRDPNLWETIYNWKPSFSC